VADTNGLPVHLALTPGEAHGQSAVFGSLPSALLPQTMLLVDRGYDADWIRQLARQQRPWANIPPKRNRKDPICFSPFLYRAQLDRTVLQQDQACYDRYDKLAATYLAFVKLASIRVWCGMLMSPRPNSGALPLDWITGSSAGAISAAVIAGSPPELRLSNSRSFWQADATSHADKSDSSRHGFAWMNSISTHLFGRAGFFYHRLSLPTSRFNGLYDLAPARERLRELICCGSSPAAGATCGFQPAKIRSTSLAIDPVWKKPDRKNPSTFSRTAMTQRWRAGFLDMEYIDPTCACKDGIQRRKPCSLKVVNDRHSNRRSRRFI
jgi:transposase